VENDSFKILSNSQNLFIYFDKKIIFFSTLNTNIKNHNKRKKEPKILSIISWNPLWSCQLSMNLNDFGFQSINFFFQYFITIIKISLVLFI